jgi:hypothetical protein
MLLYLFYQMELTDATDAWNLYVFFPVGANKCIGIYMFLQMELTESSVFICFLFERYNKCLYLCMFLSAGANKCFSIFMFFPRKLTNALVSICFSSRKLTNALSSTVQRTYMSEVASKCFCIHILWLINPWT